MTVQQPQGENCRFLRSFHVLCGHFAWVVLILRQFGRVSRFPRTAPGFAPVDGQRAKRNAPSPVGLFRPVTLCATVIYYSTRAPHLASLFSIFLKKKESRAAFSCPSICTSSGISDSAAECPPYRPTLPCSRRPRRRSARAGYRAHHLATSSAERSAESLPSWAAIPA